jgi:hypothetical protein
MPRLSFIGATSLTSMSAVLRAIALSAVLVDRRWVGIIDPADDMLLLTTLS